MGSGIPVIEFAAQGNHFCVYLWSQVERHPAEAPRFCIGFPEHESSRSPVLGIKKPNDALRQLKNRQAWPRDYLF
jgi:hypothetical protein